jgi:hypothetical protein
LGFRQVAVSEQHTGFEHTTSDVFMAIPVFKDRQVVSPRHLAPHRVMLENHGVLDGGEFDRRVEAAAANTSVS